MDRPPNPTEEAVESVNLGDQGLPVSDPSESIRSESHAPVEPNEALLKISHDMTRVLERLRALKALIDMVRRYGLRNSMGQTWKSLIKQNYSYKSYKEYWRKLDALPIIEYYVQSHYYRVRHMIGGS